MGTERCLKHLPRPPGDIQTIWITATDNPEENSDKMMHPLNSYYEISEDEKYAILYDTYMDGGKIKEDARLCQNGCWFRSRIFVLSPPTAVWLMCTRQ